MQKTNGPNSQPMSRRVRWLLFAIAFVSFAFFNQGGGWNQNSRFAMVRAVAEQQELWIDSYLIYVREGNDAPGTKLKRLPTRNGEYETDGKKNMLLWKTKAGWLCPVSNTLEGEVVTFNSTANTLQIQDSRKTVVQLTLSDRTEIKTASSVIEKEKLAVGQIAKVLCAPQPSGEVEAKIITVLDGDNASSVIYRDLGFVAATGDVAFYHGHFFPNKAPGTAFAAIPPYWLVFHLEKLFHIDPDDWWTLTVNGWLSSVLSIGIISALAVAIFYELAFAFSAGKTQVSLLATFTFAFGTMFFPNATLLFEHNLIAVALLAAFYLIYRAKNIVHEGATTNIPLYCFLAGLFGGWAAITNYISIVPVLLLGTYLAISVRRRIAPLWFSFGLIGPFILICAYNAICFGTPFTTNYQFQNPDFIDPTKSFLGVFTLPRLDLLLVILFSPFRGLFFTAPVLLIAIAALFSWGRHQRFRAECLLIGGVFAYFLLFNISFNGWDGGDVAVARYLGPAIPFLSIGLVYGFDRFFQVTSALAILSIAFMTLITIVDPQPPIGTGTATVLDKPLWQYNPVFDYELPVFLTGKPFPLLQEQEQQVLRYYDRQLSDQGWEENARRADVQRVRDDIDQRIAAGQPAPLLLARTGEARNAQYLIGDSDLSIPIAPVSAHVYGYYGGRADRDLGEIGSIQTRWNSFNLGEFLFPESRLSLVPLLILAGIMSYLVFMMARRLDRI